MDSAILHEFVVLTDICNFQLAASELSLSQSTLSKHIQKLEQEAGFSLIDRSKRAFTLTPHGALLRDYAAQITGLWESALSGLREINSAAPQRLRIAFTEMHGIYGTAELIGRFGKLHPEVALDVYEKSGPELKPMLLSGDCDFIFTAHAADSNDYRSTVFQSDRFVIALPENHPLAKREAVHLEELQNEKIIAHRRPREIALLSNYYTQNRFLPNTVASISSANTIMRLVGESVGISIITRRSAMINLGECRVALVDLLPDISFDIYMLSCRKYPLTPIAKAFNQFVKDNAGKT